MLIHAYLGFKSSENKIPLFIVYVEITFVYHYIVGMVYMQFLKSFPAPQNWRIARQMYKKI